MTFPHDVQRVSERITNRGKELPYKALRSGEYLFRNVDIYRRFPGLAASKSAVYRKV